MYNQKDTNLGGWFKNIVQAIQSNKGGQNIKGKFFQGVFTQVDPPGGTDVDPPATPTVTPISSVVQHIKTTKVDPVTMFRTIFAAKIPGDIKTAVARPVAMARPTMPARGAFFEAARRAQLMPAFAGWVKRGGLFGFFARLFAPKPEPVEEPVVDPNEYIR